MQINPREHAKDFKSLFFRRENIKFLNDFSINHAKQWMKHANYLEGGGKKGMLEKNTKFWQHESVLVEVVTMVVAIADGLF